MTDTKGPDIAEEVARAMFDFQSHPDMVWDDFRMDYLPMARAAIAAYDRLRPTPEDGWRDITTAPRDGSEFLAMRFGKEQVPSYNVIYFNADAKGDHIWGMVEGSAYHRNWPTHWRLLPSPPEGEGR